MSVNDENALTLIEIIDNMVNWADRAFDAIRVDKWKILAKRLMAASGSDLQEYIHNVVREIAGDKVIIKHEVAKKIDNLLSIFKDPNKQLELIRYVKRRAYPLVVRYMARRGEGEK